MGEAKRKSRSRRDILAGGDRCIYCEQRADDVEHMPPRVMFKEKLRLSGLEFPSCRSCNKGTSAADLVASFVARLDADGHVEGWQHREVKGLRGMLRQNAPEVWEELFHPWNGQEVWHRGASGIYERKLRVRPNGPLLGAHLGVFAAKMGMALYREHAGSALPSNGVVLAHYFTNAGLAQSSANAILRILPTTATLQQGKQTANEQFAYRYNSDGKSAVAALARFHKGLFTFTVVTCEPVLRRALEEMPDHPGSVLVRPGELLKPMPERARTLPLSDAAQTTRA